MMVKNRPTSILVVAILQLVFGGLALTIGVCGAGMELAGGSQLFNFGGGNLQAEQQKELQDALDTIPAYKPVHYGEMGLGLVLSLMMIVSGVGLLWMRSWARMLSIIYALLSIALKILVAIHTILFTAPVVSEIVKSMASKGARGAAGQPALSSQQQTAMAKFMEFAVYAGIAISLVTIIYPIVVLIIMLLPSTRAAFRGDRVTPENGEVPDYRDEQDLER